jgi:AbrB family looped-hinge helix DNA binding protein
MSEIQIARISAKGQLTIPKRVRSKAGLAPGDVMTIAVEDERLILRKLRSDEDGYLRGVQETLGEWLSAEDEDSWRDF